MSRGLILFIIAVVVGFLLNQGCPAGTSAESVYHGRSVSTVCTP